MRLAANLQEVMGVTVRAEEVLQLDNAQALAQRVRAIRAGATEVPGHD
ncbi:hypothetical protein ABZ663_29020 [Streptomyces albidoflavus]